MPHSSFPVDKITDEAQAVLFLAEYNSTAEVVWNAYTEASWAYNTNINEENKQIMVRTEFLLKHIASAPSSGFYPYIIFLY